MWFRSLHDPTKGSENNGKNTYAGVNSIPNASSIPLGYCVRFHSGNTCYLPCKYNHNCYACNRSHPANKCWNLHAGVLRCLQWEAHIVHHPNLLTDILFVAKVMHTDSRQEFQEPIKHQQYNPFPCQIFASELPTPIR